MIPKLQFKSPIRTYGHHLTRCPKYMPLRHFSTGKYGYDMVVIGGGSGGLACSQEAAKLGKKVAVVDFVKPSPQRTTWGLGGTCVNVGCIPKKLMHHASLVGKELHDANSYGWPVDTESLPHKWDVLVQNVQNHVKSLNFGYRTQLRSKNVNYLNAFAKFVDPHTVECVDKKEKITTLTADKFVIAVGGRPKYLDIPGAKEYAITSDDIFSMKKPPGKTLVVGASYIALECAGFLSGLGCDTTVMARSVFLRGFDQQMAGLVVEYMQSHETKFIRDSTPTKIEKVGFDKLKVTWRNTSGIESSDEFDTVMFAVGRQAQTGELGLHNVGITTDIDGKILTKDEQTTVPNIYAVGDVLQGKPELTPVAIKAGRWLAKRLYGASTLTMDYNLVPTTVFTPLEYSSCGMSEEAAIKLHGEENIEVYHAFVTPLEWTLPHREDNACYAKIICNKRDNERVLGIHILTPHSGEIMQGFAVAMKMGATLADLEHTVGIHPTVAEELVLLNITKRSGENPKKTGC